MPSLSSSLPQLRETLASLESYELPDRYKPLSSSSSSSPSSSPSSSSPSASNTETPEIIDPQLFQRYLKAKDSYIRRRVKHSFIEHLSSLQYSNKENENNNSNNNNNNNNPLVTISLPPIPTPQEQQTMDNNEQNVKNELLHNIRYIRKGYDNVYHKYKLLNDKKEDMRLIIQSLEEKSKQTDITIDNDHDDDNHNHNDNNNDDPNIDIDPNDNANATIQESELTMEEEKLQTLRQQKSMLQMKLHRLQLDKELIKSNIERDYGKVKDLMDARNCGGSNGSANGSANASASSNSNSSNNEADTKSATNTPIKQDRISSSTSNPTPTSTSDSLSTSTSTSTCTSASTSTSTKSINLENIQNLPSLEEIEKETHQLQEQFHNYRDMSDYYDSMKCAMETIGGMKILSITPVFADTTMSTATTTSTTTASSAAVKNDKKKMEEDEIMTSPCSSPNTSPMKNTTNAKSFNSSGSGSGSKLKKLSPPMNRRGRRQSISPNKVGSGSSSSSGSSPGANGNGSGGGSGNGSAGGSTSDERKALLMRKKNKNNDSINLKVVLLDCHIINLTLTTIVSSSLSSSSSSSSSLSSKQQNSHPQEEHSKQSQSQPMLNYRVTAAKFETPTIVTDTIHDVSMTIPPLDDLVNLCNSLKPLHDIRFILREAMARIRIISQRVDELAQLRVKYLTKITNPMKNKIKFGYGGEYQEIVCSLPCQITVVLRLTCDCPLLDGSAFIHQIVGVGGWNSSSLEKMKKKVNMKKWRSPMQVMDSLEEEIKRIVKDEGICLPKTPTLPKRLKK